MAKKIMVQGAGLTGTGKSFTVALLCRLFKEDGYDVAPFKALNLTSVTYKNGKEFGYSQALQAVSAGQKPDYRMNPFTPKLSDGKIDIILEGKSIEKYDLLDVAKRSIRNKAYEKIKKAVKKSLRSLSKDHDILCIEGAGPAKIPIPIPYLDLANMETARIANSPVLLLADNLDAAKGILTLMENEEKKIVKGIIWNKVKIDELKELGIKEEYLKLGLEGLKFAYQRAIGKEIIGIIPFIEKLKDFPELDPVLPSSKIPLNEWKNFIKKIATKAREFVNLDQIYEIMK